eukprot:Opistho-2@13003
MFRVVRGLRPLCSVGAVPRAACRSLPRMYSAEALKAPEGPKGANPKIMAIVDQISKLTLLEAAELTSTLKTTLNIKDAPVMAGFSPASAAPVAAAGPAKPEAPKEAAKTEFTVKLEKVNDDAKVKVIREVKNIVPNINLVQAKKLVESLPHVLRENVSKDEAEKIKKAITEAGGTVSIA